jgi:hypothetical protein
MPDISKLLPQFQRASMIQNTHPGRKGRLLEIPSGDSILVAGDLHGQLDILRRILLRADLGNHPKRHLLLQEVIHGPNQYPDGSDKSHQALDLVAALICQYPGRVHFLPGNHEFAQVHGRLIMKNDHFLNEAFIAGVRHAYADRAEEVLDAYAVLIESSPLALRTPNRVFLSHSLPKASSMAQFSMKNFSLPELQKSDFGVGGMFYGLFWDRDTSEDNANAFLEKADADWLITGHIPCLEGYLQPSPRHIILDCHGFPAAIAVFPLDREIGPQGIGAFVEVFKVAG